MCTRWRAHCGRRSGFGSVVWWWGSSGSCMDWGKSQVHWPVSNCWMRFRHSTMPPWQQPFPNFTVEEHAQQQEKQFPCTRGLIAGRTSK